MALDMTTALVINAKVNGEQQIQGLTRGLQGVAGASDRSATAMQRLNTVGNGLAGVFKTLLPIIATLGLVKFGKDAIDAADAMSKLSQRTGVAAPELDRFRKVAELSDTSIESLSKAFPALAKNISDAATGTGPAVDAFTQLGITLTDASGKVRSTDAVMKDIMDSFQQMEDGTEKATLASEIFGKRLGSELIPFLNSGSKAVNEMSTALTQEFADKAAVFNDRIENMTERLQTMGLEILMALMPALESLMALFEQVTNEIANNPGFKQFAEILAQVIQQLAEQLAPILRDALVLIGQVIKAMQQLPQPLQDFLKALAAVGLAVGGLPKLFGPIIAVIKTGLIPALSALGKLMLTIFATPPLGFVALLVAAGVAIYVFRDQIANAFKAIGDLFVRIGKEFNDFVIKPVADGANAVVQSIVKAFKGLANALKSPFDAVARFIRGIFNSYLNMVEKFINGAISGINKLIAQANRALSALKLPTLPTATEVSLPRFAQGGVVQGPTVAMVGEAGREYIIPESKMARASANYLMGMRGASVIPNSAAASASQGNTTVQIKTGPVLQQGGQRYVTIDDLERSLNSLAANLLGNNRSFAGRRFQGAI
jgi:phage-related protein